MVEIDLSDTHRFEADSLVLIAGRLVDDSDERTRILYQYAYMDDRTAELAGLILGHARTPQLFTREVLGSTGFQTLAEQLGRTSDGIQVAIKLARSRAGLRLSAQLAGWRPPSDYVLRIRRQSDQPQVVDSIADDILGESLIGFSRFRIVEDALARDHAAFMDAAIDMLVSPFGQALRSILLSTPTGRSITAAVIQGDSAKAIATELRSGPGQRTLVALYNDLRIDIADQTLTSEQIETLAGSDAGMGIRHGLRHETDLIVDGIHIAELVLRFAVTLPLMLYHSALMDAAAALAVVAAASTFEGASLDSRNRTAGLDTNDISVDTAAAFGFSDEELAAEVLHQARFFDGEARTGGLRPGRYHVSVSPTDSGLIRVEMPDGVSEFAAADRTLEEVGTDIALLLDSPRFELDGSRLDAAPLEAGTTDSPSTGLATLNLSRPSPQDPERDAELPQSLEGLLRWANTLLQAGAWQHDEASNRRVTRRIRYLGDYQSFPSLDDPSEQRQADAMVAGLSADVLAAISEAAGIDLPGLDEVLSAARDLAGTDGTAADMERAQHAAQALDDGRQRLLELIRQHQLELPDLAAELERPDFVADSLGWTINQSPEKKGKTLGMALGGLAGAVAGAFGGFVAAGPGGAAVATVVGLGTGGTAGKHYGEILGAIVGVSATALAAILRRFRNER